jgi:hypothetical protein
MLTDQTSVGQLTHVISQATAPAFLLGAVAAFISVLITRLNRVVDRVRLLHALPPDSEWLDKLASEIPRLKHRATMLNRSIFFAICSGITVTLLILLAFIAALVSLPHEPYVGILFILACLQFCVALTIFALEVLKSLPAMEFHG